jgi:hypothetical protein
LTLITSACREHNNLRDLSIKTTLADKLRKGVEIFRRLRAAFPASAFLKMKTKTIPDRASGLAPLRNIKSPLVAACK